MLKKNEKLAVEEENKKEEIKKIINKLDLNRRNILNRIMRFCQSIIMSDATPYVPVSLAPIFAPMIMEAQLYSKFPLPIHPNERKIQEEIFVIMFDNFDLFFPENFENVMVTELE
jgi:hypothetical protein